MNVISSESARSWEIENIWGQREREREGKGGEGVCRVYYSEKNIAGVSMGGLSVLKTLYRVALLSNESRQSGAQDSVRRLHYNGVIGFPAADVIVAIISVSYCARLHMA